MESNESINLAARVRRALAIVQPAFLGGFTLPDWISLLRRNNWRVDAEYLPRALIATLGAGATSFFKLFEDRIVLKPFDEEKWRHPVFILGLGRSGTTHLYHLLSRDPQFCFPTKFDCQNPHTFLTLRSLGMHRLLSLFPAKKRYMDNVRTGWLSPSEDKLALSVLTSSGSLMHRVFPRTFEASIDAMNPMRDVKTEHSDFNAALIAFSRKLVFLHGRRPLFKSPDHTASIPQILQVFPDAKFVTILRNPFSQFASMASMDRSQAKEWSTLQKPLEISDQMRLDRSSFLLGRYLETRDLIPKKNLVEVKYKELVSDQAATLKKIYSALGEVMPASFGVASESAYQRNKHPKLSPELKDRIRETYRPFVAAGLFDPAELR
jgi:hypothetical protein